MMLPLGTSLGRLQLLEVFDVYDGPKTFSVRSASGATFLAFWAGQQFEVDEWLYVAASLARLDEIAEGVISLREAFLNPEDGIVFHVTTSSSRGDTADARAPADVNEEMLPPVDDRLSGKRIGGMLPLEDVNDLRVHVGRAEQLIKIESRHKKHSLPAIAVELAQRAWRNLFTTMLRRAGGDGEIWALSGAPGSYSIKFAVPRTPESESAFRGIVKLIESIVDCDAADRSDRAGIRELDVLLSVLKDQDLVLKAQHQTETSEMPLSVDVDVTLDVVNNVHRLAAGYLESIEVPQADRIDRIVRLLRLLAEGREVSAATLEVVGRQVGYYKHACRILKLLNEDNSLTPAGEQMSAMRDERRIANYLRVQFETCRCGWRWISWSGGQTLEDVDPTTAERFLKEAAPGLSNSTSVRRARTLEAWCRELSQRQSSFSA